ncbi:MAG: DUF2270 domain-containing protein [Anaerolineales bacterium]|jgi:uncharacterized membrane protein|nr:DUF2270 domain-containing protein [Anaerolineales bacterium]
MSDRPSLNQRLDLEHVTRAEFINAMVHLYRGELGEATAWRSRIDTTTHWAVALSATSLSFVFSELDSERHVLIPIVSLFITFLLMMEARRYRFFDIWRSRARMIEINFYHPLLDGSEPPYPDWAETLGHDMEWPNFHMPMWEAMGRRLRRNYQWIYGILVASWVVVLLSHPSGTMSFDVILSRAAIGPISGWIVIAGMLIFYGFLLGLGLYSRHASHSTKNYPAGHPKRMKTVYH